jgi:hypothetical protein
MKRRKTKLSYHYIEALKTKQKKKNMGWLFGQDGDGWTAPFSKRGGSRQVLGVAEPSPQPL